LPALGIVLIPKCPVCWAAYLGTGAGVGLRPYGRGALLIVALLLSSSLAALVVRSRRALAGWPLAVASLGSVFIVLGRFLWASTPVAYAGIAIVVVTVACSRQAQKQRLTVPAGLPPTAKCCHESPEVEDSGCHHNS
jgi:hypothetical protein